MRKLFLVALVIGVCTPVIMAQETTKAGIYGGIQNLRFDAYGTSKQEAGQESAKVAIYGGISNLHPNVPETSEQDVNSLPQAPKSTFFSPIAPEIGRQYAINPPLNSHDAAGGASSPVQCPPNCAGRGYNRFEIYGGYSLLSYDLRLFGLFNRTRADLITRTDIFGLRTNIFDIDRHRRIHLNGGEVSATVNFSRWVGGQFDFSAHTRDIGNLDTAFPIFNDPVFGDLLVFANLPRTSFRVRNFLFGVQVKDNLADGCRARPFGHFLLGFSRQRLRIRGANILTDLNLDGIIENFVFNNETRFRRTDFALAVGGGIDIRLTDRFSIRPIKIDYLPIFARIPVLVFTPPTIIPPVGTSLIASTVAPAANFNLTLLRDIDDDRRTRNNFRIGAGVVFHF
jgi:hypothetical protein